MNRVRVFIDYWNFQLTIQKKEGQKIGIHNHRFNINWKDVGRILAEHACRSIGMRDCSYEGAGIYTSYNPHNDQGKKFNDWVHKNLNKFAGVNVKCAERRPKSLPRCPDCHREIEKCPHCTALIANRTEEKGVDTFLVTDMIRLAWEDAYDIGVLASQDSDLVPAVEFLGQKGRKIIHAAFPPHGHSLSEACWAHFDVYALRDIIRRV